MCREVMALALGKKNQALCDNEVALMSALLCRGHCYLLHIIGPRPHKISLTLTSFHLNSLAAVWNHNLIY